MQRRPARRYARSQDTPDQCLPGRHSWARTDPTARLWARRVLRARQCGAGPVMHGVRSSRSAAITIRAYLGITPAVSASAYVDESAMLIGDVTVDTDSSVWPLCVIRGDVNRIRIGARTNIQDGSIIHVTHAHAALPVGNATIVGNEVTVGHQAILHGCMIEDRCLIGMGSVVMDGALIRSRVLLGARSLVPPGRELEGGYLWLGSPVRRVRPLTEPELAWIDYSAAHYVQLKDNYGPRR